mmetsp:Transcript_12802/g.24984  ORF Transcript_12802/g.24984 Transcript_12802/m.24984 type:complete len:114 (+) Transcript_12802:497-838(+)
MSLCIPTINKYSRQFFLSFQVVHFLGSLPVFNPTTLPQATQRRQDRSIDQSSLSSHLIYPIQPSSLLPHSLTPSTPSEDLSSIVCAVLPSFPASFWQQAARLASVSGGRWLTD